MALQNPMYIDAAARHRGSQVRVLDYAAVEGKEGVLQADHLAVRALSTPTDAIDVMPGAYSVLAKHLGGEFEAYLGKILTAERYTGITPTNSSGSRTDLVILRIENPYVAGAGSWAQPADPVEGPYAYVRVIEGVPANTNHVSAYNNTWSAITLARITRPANTGIVTQAHITDLRSLAKLGGERIVIVDSPPATPPPIAQEMYMDAKGPTAVSASNVIAFNQTSFKKFPNDITFSVPIPTWAISMDVCVILNPQVDGHVWGETRLVIDGAATNVAPATFDINYVNGTQPGPIQSPIFHMGSHSIAEANRGKIKNMWLEMRMLDPPNHPGKLAASRGTFALMIIKFQRTPV